MRATAIAHPNIALIKYWGKRDRALNLPAVPSLSITLAPFQTRTTVSWGEQSDAFEINGEVATGSAAERIGSFLDLVHPARPPVHISSQNNFPTAAGLASSSSAFAALALAASAAAGHERSLKDLSILARQGSGSACRSLWGGWVTWERGQAADGTDSHGTPLAPQDHWDLRVIVALVSSEKKAISSREGMLHTEATSPLYDGWVTSAEADLQEAIAAVNEQDLRARPRGTDGPVQPIRRGRPAADDGDAQPAGGGGITFGHGDGAVLVPGAQKGDADGVDLRRQHRRVVAHQAEYRIDTKILEVVGQRLIGRYGAPCPSAAGGTIFCRFVHFPPRRVRLCLARSAQLPARPSAGRLAQSRRFGPAPGHG